MTSDELDRKIIEIKKRGLNNFVENDILKSLRKEFHEQNIEKILGHITDRFRKNIFFLNKLHGENFSAGKVKEFMGLDIDLYFNKIVYETKTLYSLKQAVMVSEFFGLPVELLLFTDLEINSDYIKKEYPALFKQSRN